MTYVHSCSTIIPVFFSEKLYLAALHSELPYLLLKVVLAVGIECHHFFTQFFHFILSLSFNISTVWICAQWHTLERCAAYWGLILGISLRDYQASHGLLTIIHWCCFKWEQAIWAGADCSYHLRDYRALGAVVRDSGGQVSLPSILLVKGKRSERASSIW